jgi:hypothetical protein
VIAPEKSAARFFERDIADVEGLDPYQRGMWWRVTTPNKGFYDFLPERLFHRPVRRAKNEEQWEDIRTEEAQQETDARQFLLPFDSALYHQRIKANQFEKSALEGSDMLFLQALLNVFWPNIESLSLNETQKYRLLQLTIVTHKIAGNIPWMEEAFGQMLEDDVKIEKEVERFSLPVQSNFAVLGDATVGVDFVLIPKKWQKKGRLLFKIGKRNEETNQLQGVSYERMSIYFPEQRGEKLFRFLCGLLVPVEWECEMKVLQGTQHQGFWLNTPQAQTILGYTTIL